MKLVWLASLAILFNSALGYSESGSETHPAFWAAKVLEPLETGQLIVSSWDDDVTYVADANAYKNKGGEILSRFSRALADQNETLISFYATLVFLNESEPELKKAALLAQPYVEKFKDEEQKRELFEKTKDAIDLQYYNAMSEKEDRVKDWHSLGALVKEMTTYCKKSEDVVFSESKITMKTIVNECREALRRSHCQFSQPFAFARTALTRPEGWADLLEIYKDLLRKYAVNGLTEADEENALILKTASNGQYLPYELVDRLLQSASPPRLNQKFKEYLEKYQRDLTTEIETLRSLPGYYYLIGEVARGQLVMNECEQLAADPSERRGFEERSREIIRDETRIVVSKRIAKAAELLKRKTVPARKEAEKLLDDTIWTAHEYPEAYIEAMRQYKILLDETRMEKLLNTQLPFLVNSAFFQASDQKEWFSADADGLREHRLPIFENYIQKVEDLIRSLQTNPTQGIKGIDHYREVLSYEETIAFRESDFAWIVRMGDLEGRQVSDIFHMTGTPLNFNEYNVDIRFTIPETKDEVKATYHVLVKGGDVDAKEVSYLKNGQPAVPLSLKSE